MSISLSVSTASCERSLSVLCHIKTLARNSRIKDKLGSVAVLEIERRQYYTSKNMMMSMLILVLILIGYFYEIIQKQS
jgi:hypothetical protein